MKEILEKIDVNDRNTIKALYESELVANLGLEEGQTDISRMNSAWYICHVVFLFLPPLKPIFPDNVVDKDVHQVCTIGDKGSEDDVVECKEYTHMFKSIIVNRVALRWWIGYMKTLG